jgi:hypothetical protein
LACAGSIIYAGVDNNELGPSFDNLNWKVVSLVQIAFILYIFFLSLLGFFVFSWTRTCFTVIYAILLMISILMTCVLGCVVLAINKSNFLKFKKSGLAKE